MKKILASILLAAFISINSAAFANDGLISAEANKASQITTNKAVIEHLPTYNKTLTNTVSINDTGAIVNSGNVMKVAFGEKFTTKTAKMGDVIPLILKEDFKTAEGRVLLPAGTKILATVDELTLPKNWNKNAKVTLKMNEIVLPNGQKGTFSAVVKTKSGYLKRSPGAAFGKAAVWTVGLFGVGAGVGAAIGAIAGAVGTGCLAIGMPVGGGLGLIAGSATKGLNYTAKPGKTIYITLDKDLAINF